MMESILIITYDMIPYCQWGACQRMYYLAKFLKINGYKVFLVHKKNKYHGYFDHNIPFYSLPIEIAKSSHSNCNLRINDRPIIIDKYQKHIVKIISNIEKILYNEIFEGWGIQGESFINATKDEMVKIIINEKIKKVIISGPPFSIFGISKFIKQKYPYIKIILDYRDPWNLWGNKTLISCYKEKTYLKMADKVIFTNEILMSDVSKEFNVDINKFATVLNGYSEESWQKALMESRAQDYRKANKLVVAHIGSINLRKGSYRDISILLDALYNYKYKKDILIRIIGIDKSIDVSLIKNRLGNAIEFIPMVNHIDSLKYMLESDILLILHTHNQSAKYLYPAKIYDYIKSNKPIWGISNTNHAAILDLIKKYKLGITSINDYSDILTSFDLIHGMWMDNNLEKLRKNENLIISNYSREYQNKKYIEILSET